MCKKLIIAGLLLVVSAAMVQAEKTEFFREFEKNYKALDVEVYNYISDMTEVENFVYQKGLATFTFKKGKMILLRHVLDRPTAAIFIGEGNCRIDLPSHNERQALLWCSGDSVVNEDFEHCFIRMTDDLDKKLAAEYTLVEHKIDWKEYNTYKNNQSEFFFRPIVMHEYDNYFQLLRSAYERQADGYFWVDFNRHVFKYDPTCPEPNMLAYEHEGGSFSINEAVAMQDRAEPLSSDLELSDVTYPTTMLARSGELELSGLSGKHINRAEVDLKLLINRDSLRFVSLFLHYNLDVDSIYYKGIKTDYKRRGDFTFVGLILPEYLHGGDTLDLKIWYHGRDYSSSMPFVKDPAPSEINIDLITTIDFDLFVPGKSEPIRLDGRKKKYTVAPAQPYRHFSFQSVATGFDTIVKPTPSGTPINFLKNEEFSKGRHACFTPDKKYEEALVSAFNFASPRLGQLLGDEDIYVYPDSTLSMPGLIEMKQLACYDELTGELHVQAGLQISRQWFGSLMKPASNRELWLASALPDYFSLYFTQKALSAKEFYMQLSMRRQLIEFEIEKNQDMPIGAGERASSVIRTAKGSWLIHMLRFLMYDTEKPAELNFLRFLNEFGNLSNNQAYTNRDFVTLAEKYCGLPLESFFEQWLFSRGIPECQVDWSTQQRDDGYYVKAITSLTNVGDNFSIPIWLRIVEANKSATFEHPVIKAGITELEFGPLTTEPEELIFNEFLSILCKTDVDRND